MTADSQGPGVRFPPPFVFVGAYLAAWLLERQLGFEIDGDGAGAVQEALGITALTAGLAFMAWGLITFAQARTAIIPNRAARQLVTTGPYGMTRNPMYVGMTSIYVGLALMMNAAWPLVLLPLVLITLVATVIVREERYLRAEFGASYDEYCRRVRRWL